MMREGTCMDISPVAFSADHATRGGALWMMALVGEHDPCNLWFTMRHWEDLIEADAHTMVCLFHHLLSS